MCDYACVKNFCIIIFLTLVLNSQGRKIMLYIIIIIIIIIIIKEQNNAAY